MNHETAFVGNRQYCRGKFLLRCPVSPTYQKIVVSVSKNQ